MVNQEIAREWVKRLRSGEYKQGTGRLAGVDETGAVSYCCLGVLCEIAAEQGVTQKGVANGWGSDYFVFDEKDAMPPFSVAEWLGLYDSLPYWKVPVPDDLAAELVKRNVNVTDGHAFLPEINDYGNVGFDVIADLIEAAFLK